MAAAAANNAAFRDSAYTSHMTAPAPAPQKAAKAHARVSRLPTNVPNVDGPEQRAFRASPPARSERPEGLSSRLARRPSAGSPASLGSPSTSFFSSHSTDLTSSTASSASATTFQQRCSPTRPFPRSDSPNSAGMMAVAAPPARVARRPAELSTAELGEDAQRHVSPQSSPRPLRLAQPVAQRQRARPRASSQQIVPSVHNENSMQGMNGEGLKAAQLQPTKPSQTRREFSNSGDGDIKPHSRGRFRQCMTTNKLPCYSGAAAGSKHMPIPPVSRPDVARRHSEMALPDFEASSASPRLARSKTHHVRNHSSSSIASAGPTTGHSHRPKPTFEYAGLTSYNPRARESRSVSAIQLPRTQSAYFESSAFRDEDGAISRPSCEDLTRFASFSTSDLVDSEVDDGEEDVDDHLSEDLVNHVNQAAACLTRGGRRFSFSAYERTHQRARPRSVSTSRFSPPPTNFASPHHEEEDLEHDAADEYERADANLVPAPVQSKMPHLQRLRVRRSESVDSPYQHHHNAPRMYDGGMSPREQNSATSPLVRSRHGSISSRRDSIDITERKITDSRGSLGSDDLPRTFTRSTRTPTSSSFGEEDTFSPNPVHRPRRSSSLTSPLATTNSNSSTNKVAAGLWSYGERIGSGSFGEVFLGLNLESGVQFAVKRINNVSNDENKVRQLKSEIEVMRSLQHPNIVQYYGTSSCANGNVEIFLEYVTGGSLASIVKAHGALSEQLVTKFTYHITCGVEYLHSKNVIHRDIKGANVLITQQGVAKLADFGCSKQLEVLSAEERDSTLHNIRGSIPWMAPEMVMQSGHSFPADIWSLGCTILEMASGSCPWPELREHLQALFVIGQTKVPPPIPATLHGGELESLMLECFAIKPEERATASELLMHPLLRRTQQPE